MADACDTLRAVIGAPFDSYSGRLPDNHVRFRVLAGELLERGLQAAEEAGCLASAGAAASAGDQQLLVAFLQFMSRDEDRHYALRAICYLRLLGREGRSLEEIGEEFGVVRATVHAIYRQLQKRHPDLRSRSDKSPAAREQSRRRRLGARKTYLPWCGLTVWQRPVALPAAA